MKPSDPPMSSSPRCLLVIGLGALGAVLMACAVPGSSGSEEVPDRSRSVAGGSPPASEHASAPDAPAAPEGIPEDVWRAILASLSERLGAPAGGVSVVRAEAVTWSDGALGCPQEGELYTQALVDGYQVVVEVDGLAYDYRVGRGTDVRLCENPPLDS